MAPPHSASLLFPGSTAHNSGGASGKINILEIVNEIAMILMGGSPGDVSEEPVSGVSRIWLGGGGPASPTYSKGQFFFNFSNFVHDENTISEHMAIFKKNIYKLFKYL